jgi:hypothetical protein
MALRARGRDGVRHCTGWMDDTISCYHGPATLVCLPT